MTNFDIGQTTDIPVAVSGPDNYPDPLPTTNLLPKGEYIVRLEDAETDKDMNGERKVFSDSSYAVVVKRLRVVEGPFANRTITFQRVFTKPYERPRNSGRFVSGVGDLIRAFNPAYADFKSISDIEDRIGQLVAEGATGKIKLDWEGYDKDYYDQIVAAESIDTNDRNQVRAARKRATIKGMWRALKKGDGGYYPVFDGPSGKRIDARLVITEYVPQGK